MQRNDWGQKTETWGPQTLKKSEEKEDTAEVYKRQLREKSKVK